MIIDNALEIIAPFSCVRCKREGKLVCEECKRRVAEPKVSTCALCNSLTKDFQLCQACRRKTKLRGVLVASQYKGGVKTLIRMLKYERAQRASRFLADLLVQYVNSNNYDYISWVPVSSRRFRQRGYNQAKLIAKRVAAKTDVPYIESLGRLGHARQVGTDRKLRILQLKGRMYVIKPERLKNKRVLIIDDVLTTGATLSECANVLSANGAKSVWGAAVAKH